MTASPQGAATPRRILHAMLRVADIDRSVAFYRDAFGMTEFRREAYPTGGFTLCFIGYGEEAGSTVLELTQNHDARAYRHGDAFGHIALEVDDIHAVCARLETQGVTILRAPGLMTHIASDGRRDVIAFAEDPDGYRIELIAAEPASWGAVR